MTKLYLLLAGLGLIGPYYFLFQFVAAHGLNVRLLVEQLFANSISTFFAVDLVITAIVFWVWSYRESQKLSIKRWWLVVIATLTIGPSFALPMFLFVRAKHPERSGGRSSTSLHSAQTAPAAQSKDAARNQKPV